MYKSIYYIIILCEPSIYLHGASSEHLHLYILLKYNTSYLYTILILCLHLEMYKHFTRDVIMLLMNKMKPDRVTLSFY